MRTSNSFWLALLAGIGSFVVLGCNHHGAWRASNEVCDSESCPDGVACLDDQCVCHHPTVHALARDLDQLEWHIDWFGSVVAKVPDVWGQARLTQYREEFEGEMSKELGNFSLTLSGSLAR